MFHARQGAFTKWLVPALVLGSLAAPAVAGDGSTTGSVQAGVNFIEADPNHAAKFEEYRDVPEGPVLDNFDLEWNDEQELFTGGMFVEVNAVDVVQEDQRFNLTFGSRGLWKGTLNYQENPRLFGDGSRLLYGTDGHGNFTLDDTLQSAMQAAPTSADTTPADGEWDTGTKGAILRDAIDQQANPIEVGWHRKTGSAAFEFTPTQNWTFGFDAQRERRTGTKVFPVTTNGFSEISELPAPIDYTTDFLTPYVEFQMKNWLVGAKYTWSDFNNDETIVTWDNVVQLNDGPLNGAGTGAPTGHARMSAGTDNEMHQGQIYLAGKLPGHTRVNASASQSTTTQNDPFLDQTVNSVLQPLLETAPYLAFHLPHDLNGKYENDMYDVRIDSRPTNWFRVKGWWHEYDQQNKNPQLVALLMSGDSSIPVDPTVTGSTTIPKNANTLRTNLPYSYDRTSYGLLLGFQPADFADIQLSYENENTDRDFTAVNSQDEDTWKLTADFEVTEKFSVRATARTQDRNGGHYDPEYLEASFPLGESTLFAANEGERKTMWADRKKDSYALMAEVTPIAKLSIYAQYDYAKSHYYDPNSGERIGESETENRLFPDGVTRPVDILLAGRIKDDVTDYTLGFGIHASPNWEISLEHTWEYSNISMASRYRNVTGFYDTRPGSPPLPAGGQVSMGWDFAEDNWGSDMKDSARTLGLSWSGKWAEGKWSTRGDLSWTEGLGDIKNTYAAGQGTIPAGIGGRATDQVIGAAGDNTLLAFPQLDNEYTVATLSFERNIANGWDIGLQYWYERWKYEDWQSDLKAPYIGNPSQDPADATWIQLGTDFQDYENHIVEVYARYHF